MPKPIRRLLVANRGEIACRIMRTCRDMGIETVAVYSEADAGARHVEMADSAVAIGPAPALQSYMDRSRVLDAAREASADAVHPGYGFLSENADFARAVAEAGLVWVGPDPETVEMMGNKERARAVAREAGLPLLPASDGHADPSSTDLGALAEATGFPLLVKAAAGGGGIGMQRVDAPQDLARVAEGAAKMAARTFGDGTVYLERLVQRARHVEIQVFGDGRGGAVHLGERDCSIQRRFQKVVEESPAPGLSGTVRDRMCRDAVALARHVSYAGAGTVEFIVDAETQEYFFLEMNTRIQVEHPVTEMRSGVDLVRLQIELAQGKAGVLEAAEADLEGAAIECRLYAERPEKRFLPSTGTLETFTLPTAGPDLRIDTGLAAGDAVTRHYDPMLAKIIAGGSTRAEAIARMQDALEDVEIVGVSTNLLLLRRLMAHEAFAAGDVATDFLEVHGNALLPTEA